MPEPVREFPLDTPVPETFSEALAGMVNRSFLRSERYQQQQWRANRLGALPKLVEFEGKLVKRMRALGVPMFAHNMIRSAAEQEKLLRDGVSRAGGGQSAHNYGLAVDIVHSARGWDLKAKEWALIGHVGKEVAKACGVKVEWGGDWNFYDPAHWEVEDWRVLKGKFPFPPE